MEELRNYVQHRGLSVHSLSYSSWRSEEKGQVVHRNALVPYVHPKLLIEDKKFKRSILKELTEAGDKVDLRPLLTGYVAGIASLHAKVRNTISDRVKVADECFHTLINKYKKDGQEDTLGLIAAKFGARGVRREAVQLFDDLITRRKFLERRSRLAPIVERVYTTNEPTRGDNEWIYKCVIRASFCVRPVCACSFLLTYNDFQ